MRISHLDSGRYYQYNQYSRKVLCEGNSEKWEMLRRMACKAEDDYYGAHGAFSSERSRVSLGLEGTPQIFLGWSENKYRLVIARSGATKQSWWGGNEIATHLSGARNDS